MGLARYGVGEAAAKLRISLGDWMWKERGWGGDLCSAYPSLAGVHVDIFFWGGA